MFPSSFFKRTKPDSQATEYTAKAPVETDVCPKKVPDGSSSLNSEYCRDLNFTDLEIDKYRVPIHDNRSKESDLGMIEHFDNVYDKMKYYIDNDQGVLVHCRAGMQRSATVVALYMMRKYKINFDNARKIIRKKRCIAFYPVINFIGPLKYFETKFNV